MKVIDILLYISLGLLIGHMVSFLSYMIMGEDEKIGFVSGSFIVLLPISLFLKCINSIRVFYIRKNFVPFALFLQYNWKDEVKKARSEPTLVEVFRIKPNKIKEYKLETNPYVEDTDEAVILCYLKQIDGKYVENANNLLDFSKDKEHRKYGQYWIDSKLKTGVK